MKAIRLWTIFVAIVMLTACRVSDELRHSGDTATINLQSGSSFTAELLCIKDSSLVVVPERSVKFSQQKVSIVPFQAISSLEVEGYANRKWETSMLLFQIIPTGIFVIAAANADSDNIGPAAVLFGLPTALVYIIFEASTPDPPSAKGPLKDETVQHLKKYLKFPAGLTDDQLREVLTYYQQSDVEKIQ